MLVKEYKCGCFQTKLNQKVKEGIKIEKGSLVEDFVLIISVIALTGILQNWLKMIMPKLL